MNASCTFSAWREGAAAAAERMRSCGGLRATRSTDISGEGSRATSASRLPRNLPRDELAKHPVLMAVSNAADYSAARSFSAYILRERNTPCSDEHNYKRRRWRIMSHALSVQIWSRVEIDYVHYARMFSWIVWNGRTNYTHSLIMYILSLVSRAHQQSEKRANLGEWTRSHPYI